MDDAVILFLQKNLAKYRNILPGGLS